MLCCPGDELLADTGGQVFQEIGNAEAQMHVVDDARAEGVDGLVQEFERRVYLGPLCSKGKCLSGAKVNEGIVGGEWIAQTFNRNMAADTIRK